MLKKVVYLGKQLKLNIDKRVERKDFVKILLPFYDNQIEELEKDVEILIMKKGKMRGQGFLNFKSMEKAVEIFDSLNGIVLGNKSLKMEFSSNKRVQS